MLGGKRGELLVGIVVLGGKRGVLLVGIVMFGGKTNSLKNRELDIRIKDIQSRAPNMGLKKDIIFDKNFKEL